MPTLDAPRRLHPGTVLLGILRQAPSTLLGLPAILAVTSEFPWYYVIALALVATLVTGLFKWLDWRRFTYALTDDSVVIESGLLSRNRRIIPFERVLDVDIERKLLARIFGLAKVKLETGGSGEDEGDLDSVSLTEAYRLREVIRRRGVAVDSAPAASAEASPIVFAMGVPRVVLWGLFNFSLVWLGVLFGTLQYFEDWLGFDFTKRSFWRQLFARTELTTDWTVLAWLVAGIAIASLGVVAGLVRTVLRDFGFTLRDEDGRYRRSRGLLTHSEVVIALRRVQLAVIDTGWVRRRLGWSRLKLQTMGGEGETGTPEVAPFARDDEVDRLLAPLRMVRADPEALTRVSSGHVWRAVLRHVGVPAVAIVIGSFFALPILFALPLLLPVLAVALLRRRYHRYGLAGEALPGNALYVQRGVLTRKQWIVPVHNVQVVTIRRSWLQRRLGVATLHPDTAGGAVLDGASVRDIRVGDAWALAAALRERRLGVGEVPISVPLPG
ncbi:PH domain-containing protein [Sphingomonas sp. S1-29]|uniref:PH domain-containing protein n=1 Tax=Sphingomonas sp. S1-29 TaxID=2991074 RepID=UPI002240ACD4|nr:PH domain-containing protein [Sphingomonas sp. S1-29]UZK68526.1 PH domain-containing protein [Sphingomonas sp. S1-29]